MRLFKKKPLVTDYPLAGKTRCDGYEFMVRAYDLPLPVLTGGVEQDLYNRGYTIFLKGGTDRTKEKVVELARTKGFSGCLQSDGSLSVGGGTNDSAEHDYGLPAMSQLLSRNGINTPVNELRTIIETELKRHIGKYWEPYDQVAGQSR